MSAAFARTQFSSLFQLSVAEPRQNWYSGTTLREKTKSPLQSFVAVPF